MIWAVLNSHNGFEDARRSLFPYATKQEVFKSWLYVQSHSLLFLGPWCYKEGMTTPEQKPFCVLQFAKHESVVSVQRAFRRQFQSDPPSANSIRGWYQQFQTKGCLCKGKSAGRPNVSEERVERVRQSFPRSLKEICAPCESWTGDVDYDVWGRCEALSSSLGTVPVETITPDMLTKVWQEVGYRMDVCRVTKVAYMAHM
jgi:hypothetical protein